MSAIILLPKEGLDINDYINAELKQEFNILINNLNMAKVKLEITKFELNYTSEVNKYLYNLGIKSF